MLITLIQNEITLIRFQRLDQLLRHLIAFDRFHKNISSILCTLFTNIKDLNGENLISEAFENVVCFARRSRFIVSKELLVIVAIDVREQVTTWAFGLKLLV